MVDIVEGVQQSFYWFHYEVMHVKNGKGKTQCAQNKQCNQRRLIAILRLSRAAHQGVKQVEICQLEQKQKADVTDYLPGECVKERFFNYIVRVPKPLCHSVNFALFYTFIIV